MVADVEKRHIVVLKLDLSFAVGKVAISKGEQLRLAEPKVALVIHRPFIFLRHSERVDGARLNA